MGLKFPASSAARCWPQAEPVSSLVAALQDVAYCPCLSFNICSAFYGFIDRTAEDMTGNRERERG